MSTPLCKIFTAFENIQSCADSSELDGFFTRIPVKTKHTMFDFSLFWKEQSWACALDAATDADIIIISLRGETDLPVPVKRWMETWPLFNPAKHVALVVVFENQTENLPPQNDLIAYCQKLAEEHGLSFFCNRGGIKSVMGEVAEFESSRLNAVCCTD